MKTQLRLYPICCLIFVISFGSCKKGDTGPEGPAGPQGATGQQGIAGPAGKDGSSIYAGTTAPASATGRAGDYYLNRSNGNFYGPKTNSGWGNPFSLVGPTGATGTAGSKILSGNNNPSAQDGVSGDFYLNKTTYTLYGPKTGAGWGLGLELRGKDGTQGVRSFITPPFNSFSGPVFYTLPGITEDQLNNGYVAAMWRREQLLVNPGFYRLYPLRYTFEFVTGSGRYLSTLYHFIVRGGQIGVTMVNNSPSNYALEPTADFRYNFRFIFIESGTVQQLSAKHPGVNFNDPQQVNKLLNF